MKKYLKWLILPLLIAVLIVFVSCNQEAEPEEHTTHTWVSSITKDPTCTEKGVRTLTCSVCGETKTEPIPATGHSFSSSWERNETYHWHVSSCTHEGLKGSFEPHTWDTFGVTVEPTCTTEGTAAYTCKCGATKTEIIPAQHSFSKEWTSDADYHWHAASCEHTEEVSDLAEHIWKKVSGQDGVFKCSVCGEQITPSLPQTISLNKTTATLSSGDTVQLTATATPEGSWQDVIWTSSNTAYASVDSNGLVSVNNTSFFNFLVTITATSTVDSTKKATCSIMVNAVPSIGMITVGPGEDSSKAAVISWHAPTTGSYLEYTDADGEAFVHMVGNELCNETLSEADWRDTAGEELDFVHYRCKVYLEDLTPNSTYKYRIKDAGGGYSDVGTFRTAESDTTFFQFMWLSDLHTPKGGESYINRVRELIDYAQAKEGVDLDFVLFTGDMVNKGQIYKHWNYWSDSGLLDDMTYAFVCGNHDYYGWNDKDRTTNDYYKEFAAYPANSTTGGKSVLDSSYWFIWNRVLFVCIDNFTTESAALSSKNGASLSSQIAWFRAVVEANEGNYDYLIYAQHLPFFKELKICEYGFYNDWRAVFDEYQVDFALSSDEHTYSRTYPLYSNHNPSYTSKTNSNPEKAELIDGKVSKGTVYVVSNQTEGGSISALKNEASAGGRYVEYTSGGVGGVYFTVTPTEVTLHLIGAGGREYDKITVLKKDR